MCRYQGIEVMEKTIPEQLQIEVYECDRIIASYADDLRNETRNGYDRENNRKAYDGYVVKRAIIIECMHKLIEVNL